jgi:sulfotransferase family protein/aspartyl/asparaginyl beta-hydroxylase
VKLPSPFFRLPVCFDVGRLRAEIESLPADAWTRHPQEYAGNTAARLITVGGQANDLIAGAMQPTPALLASPYLQQVLASFNTVWSRSRLMRIDGGGSVPAHSDTNHHWFHRVRVHIPVITRPEVRFFCGDQDVHMAAGEAWIFDNWREHKVLNPTPDARIHLVADTAGSSAFWRLITQSQSAKFDQPQQNSRLVSFDPAARPKLMIERFNVWPLMPPSEVEQLAFDLLADLAPVDQRPESVEAVSQFVGFVIELCHDWRSLWYLYGDRPEARNQFEKLADATRRNLSELPPVRVASTGHFGYAVLQARLFSMLLGSGNASRQEAAEFNVVSTQPDGATGQRTPAPAAGTKAPGARPLERPLVILSAPRAGSTLLFETLAQAAGVYTIGGESHEVFETIPALHPARSGSSSNRLTAEQATEKIVTELRRRFAARLRDRDGRPPAPGASVRLLEKTPKNALRVPFLLRVFPDVRFIFLHREPRTNLSSMMEAWRTQGWVTYRRLPGWTGAWSLLLPPGYEQMKDRPLEEIVAFQWRVANETILDDLAELPRDRWTSVRYEDLLANPASVVAKLLEFAGISMDPRLEEYLSKPLPLSRYTQTKPDPDKWKRNAAEIERVLPSLAAVSARLPQ